MAQLAGDTVARDEANTALRRGTRRVRPLGMGSLMRYDIVRRHIRFCGLYCAVFVLLGAAFGARHTAFAQSAGEAPAASAPAETADFAITNQIVQEIQVRLSAIGYNPGGTDGTIGPRTRQAIRSYENDVGLPVTGEVSKALYDRLTSGASVAAVSPATAPAAPAPTPAPVAPEGTPAAPAAPSDRPECFGIASSEWQFQDSTGSRFRVSLETDGIVLGPVNPDRWDWNTTGDGVVISYDSGIGLTVRRVGRQTARDEMTGTAEDSRGRTWSWTATRVRWTSPSIAGTCLAEPPTANASVDRGADARP